MIRWTMKWLTPAGLGLLALMLASWWLWGAAAHRHWSAASDSMRETALAYEPTEVRTRAMEKTIQEAAAETQKLAALVHRVGDEVQEGDKQIEHLEKSQAADEGLLASLRGQFDRLGETQFVVINDRRFTPEEVAADAETILGRHKARADEIADLRAHRDQQVQLRRELNADLRDRLARLRQTELGQQRIARLVERSRFAESISRTELGNAAEDALAEVEAEQAQIVRELTSSAAASKVMAELRGGGATPAADELDRQRGPSLETRIDKVLHTERLAKAAP